MDRNKVMVVVKGYLLKRKKDTVLTIMFLCFITMSLLVGNQLFENVQTANQWNAEALEGKQHVTYYKITIEELEKIRAYPSVAEAGASFSLGRTEDGTEFAYIDESFRKMAATVADKNMKQVIDGHWAEKENEVVMTRNYMEKYHLEIGDTIFVDLTATDADTGDILFQLPDQSFIVTGVIDNVTGFMDRKIGYVSKELAYTIFEKETGAVTLKATVQFKSPEHISEQFQNLNTHLGYEGEDFDTLEARKNFMLADAVEDNGNLKKQNRIMNFIIWLVCIMVVYNIFYNRFFEKKRDFMNLRKMGFGMVDLYKITAAEFLILFGAGFATGILLGLLVNRQGCSGLMRVFISTYDAGELASPELSLPSVKNAVLVLLLALIPSVVTAGWYLRAVTPVELMRSKRKNNKKIFLSCMTVSLSAVLISVLGIQENQSDAGLAYIKSYVPGDLQLTAGSIFENILGGNIPEMSSQVLEEIKGISGVKQTQSYEINYERNLFLCKEKSKLNADGGYYDRLEEMERDIDGKQQCLYNVILVATDYMQALVPSYDGNGSAAVMEGELADTLNLKPGDVFTIYDEALIQNDSMEGCASVDVKLLDTENIILSENHIGGNLLIVDKNTASMFEGEQYRQVINLWVEEGRESEVAARLKRMAEYGSMSFHSAREQMQGYIDSDRSQRTLRLFFIILLMFIGVLTHFNTVFTNLLNQRNDFTIMHKIGIRKSEIYQRVILKGFQQGVFALVLIGMAQIFLCISRHMEFADIFIVTDVGVLASCMLFPAIVMFCMYRRQFC